MKNNKKYTLFLLITPLLLLIFIFSYMPLYGWLYAFYDYKLGLGLVGSKFVGFKNFANIFIDKYMLSDILTVLKNTLGISFLGILFSPLPMFFAILLNEITRTNLRKFIQTGTTIPHFISWILVYSVAYAMFSVNDGFINRLLLSLNLIDEPINFLASDKHVWLSMTGWGIWKGLGWGAIIYIASLAGINPELYEAARIDGANRFQQTLYITIPGLIPTYLVLLVLSIGNLISNGFEQFYLFQNPLNKHSIEVLDLYVYNQGIGNSNYSMATVVSIFKSVVSISLLLFANNMAKILRSGQGIV